MLTLKIFFGTTWELSRPWALLTKCVERIVVPRQRIGERHLEQASVPDPCRFGWIYPQLLVVVAITFTYQVITPFMAPFGLTYFSLAYVVYKQQALYVYVNEYESGGVFLPLLLGRTLSVLAAAQALLCLYMLLKENLWGTVLLVPLPVAIMYFRRFLRLAYDPLVDTVPYDGGWDMGGWSGGGQVWGQGLVLRKKEREREGESVWAADNQE